MKLPGLRSLRRLIASLNAAAATASDPRQSDTYIVEFPKSGVTWLSCILANAALMQSGRREVATFVNAHLFIPDVHVSRSVGNPVYDRPPVRMIKSHSCWNPNYKFVIYLARHPVDVMQSYYRYLVARQMIPRVEFDAFCRSKAFGIPAWRRHVNSWLVGADVPNRLHLLTYEGLITDAVREVAHLSRNFGWNLDREVITKAVGQSTAESMKESERFYASRNPRHVPGFVKGDDRVHVGAATIDWISKECAAELTLLGYASKAGADASTTIAESR